jgi:hypothetical protein
MPVRSLDTSVSAQAGVLDGLIHGDISVGCGITHEAQHLAIYVILEVYVYPP